MEVKGSVTPYSIVGMHAAGLIKPSPNLTMTSGMRWVRTPAGNDQVARIEALEAEQGEKYGPVP